MKASQKSSEMTTGAMRSLAPPLLPIHEDPKSLVALELTVTFCCNCCDGLAPSLVIAKNAQTVKEYMPRFFLFLEMRSPGLLLVTANGVVAQCASSDML